MFWVPLAPPACWPGWQGAKLSLMPQAQGCPGGSKLEGVMQSPRCCQCGVLPEQQRSALWGGKLLPTGCRQPVMVHRGRMGCSGARLAQGMPQNPLVAARPHVAIPRASPRLAPQTQHGAECWCELSAAANTFFAIFSPSAPCRWFQHYFFFSFSPVNSKSLPSFAFYSGILPAPFLFDLQ